MFRNLYLNGCSFTAGHLLKDHLTWGHLIADHYNSNLFNHKVYPINWRIDSDFIRGAQTDIKSYREIS